MDLLEYIIGELKAELADVPPELRAQLQATLAERAQELYEEFSRLRSGERPQVEIAAAEEDQQCHAI